jgi:hypothetical protein
LLSLSTWRRERCEARSLLARTSNPKAETLFPHEEEKVFPMIASPFEETIDFKMQMLAMQAVAADSSST